MSFEKEWEKMKKEMADLQSKRAAALSEMMKISEKYGIPFEESVNASNTYIPKSFYQKYRGQNDILETYFDIEGDCFGFNGWIHSNFC